MPFVDLVTSARFYISHFFLTSVAPFSLALLQESVRSYPSPACTVCEERMWSYGPQVYRTQSSGQPGIADCTGFDGIMLPSFHN